MPLLRLVIARDTDMVWIVDDTNLLSAYAMDRYPHFVTQCFGVTKVVNRTDKHSVM